MRQGSDWGSKIIKYFLFCTWNVKAVKPKNQGSCFTKESAPMIIFGTNVEADFSAFVPLNRCLFCLKERLMMLHIRDFLCTDVHCQLRGKANFCILFYISTVQCLFNRQGLTKYWPTNFWFQGLQSSESIIVPKYFWPSKNWHNIQKDVGIDSSKQMSVIKLLSTPNHDVGVSDLWAIGWPWTTFTILATFGLADKMLVATSQNYCVADSESFCVEG